MKITGVKKLLRQLDDLPETAHSGLVKAITNTARAGANKAKAIAPVLDGDFRGGINSHVIVSENRIAGFINFYDGDEQDGLAANAINYGWTKDGAGTGHPANTRAHTVTMIAPRHKRAVSRNIKKAIKEALNG